MKQTILLLSIFLTLSCSEDTVTYLNLKTDLPEIIPIVEQFNRDSDKIKVVINTEIDERNTDIVIFNGQPQSAPYEMENLSSLFKTRLNRDDFYKDILKSVEDDKNNIKILPLAFDVSGLMYNKNRFKHTRVISSEEFIANETIKFSPYWDKDFIMWYYLSNMPSFDKNNNFLDLQLFIHTSNKMKSIITNNKDKWDEEQFNKKYLHLSPAVLIKSNTIEYYFINFSDFIKLNNKYSDEIAFSFISSNDLIIANDSLIYAGIPAKSKKSKESKDFLVWLFNKENQNNYISSNIKNSGLHSMFLGKLSTLSEVSEELIPYYYPQLGSFIPGSDLITIPDNLPPLWGSLKKQVFIPAFTESRELDNDKLEEKYNKLFIEWFKKHKK